MCGAFRTLTIGAMPAERATAAIFVALACGMLEGLLRAAVELDRPGAEIGSLATGLGARLGVYAVIALIALRMRAGERWARLTLLIGLGTVGLASLVAEPIAATLSANGFGPLTVEGAAIGIVRVVHVLAVCTAVACLVRRAPRRV